MASFDHPTRTDPTTTDPTTTDPTTTKPTAQSTASTLPHLQVLMVNVHDWHPTPTQVDGLLAQLQPEERARVLRFRLEIDKHRSLTGRILLRHMAHHALNFPWNDLRFKRTEENKPYLFHPQRTGYNCNVSHHGNWVAGACDTRALVGIDVMRYERPRGCKNIPEFFGTMRQYFTTYEWNTIEHSSTTQPFVDDADADDASGTTGTEQKETVAVDRWEKLQLRQFYKHWALKESYIKAIGIGLGFELSRAEFRYVRLEQDNNTGVYVRTECLADSTHAVMYIDGALQKEWTFEIQEPDEEHCVVVAMGPFQEATPHFLDTLALESKESPPAASVPPTLCFEHRKVGSLLPMVQ